MTAKVKQTGRLEADQVAAAAAARNAEQLAVADTERVLDDAPVADAIAAAPAEQSERHEAAVAAAAAPTDEAATVVAEAAMPTEAPAAMSIGELAQAAAAATDAAPADAPADAPAETTAAPAAEEAAQSGGMSPWLIGGLAVLGVGGIAAAADSGGSSPSPAPAGDAPAPIAPTPVTPTPVTPPPPPPPPADPAKPANMTEAQAYTKPGATAAIPGTIYFTDTNSDGQVNAGERVVIYNEATGKYYELVNSMGTWAEASAGASQRGGYLVVIDDATEAAFLQNTYGYAPTTATVFETGAAGRPTDYASTAPIYGGVPIDNLAGDLGAWVGLAGTGTGWEWTTGPGAPLPLTNSPLWLTHETWSRPGEPATDQRGALIGGNNLTTDTTPGVDPNPAATQILYHLEGTDDLPYYIVEYDTVAAVNGAAPAAPASGVTLDSVSGGAPLAATATDSYVSTNLSALLETTV